MSGTWALIVAAGRGSRLGNDLPKQYLKIGDSSILSMTLDKFLSHKQISGVIVVIHPDDENLFKSNCPQTQDRVLIQHGGATRQISVFNGLRALETVQPEAVLIHDAARPFVSVEVISNLITETQKQRASIAASPVVDSLKIVENNAIKQDTDREGLWHAQTPQAFPYEMIFKAHKKASGKTDYTDDAGVAKAAGHPISIVPSGKENFKITTTDDLALAKIMVGKEDKENLVMESRTGFGYDVHCFEEGDHVTLCGVDIPHTKKLKGHSDADVGLHALTDAILGALCEGDIGTHFPPSDPQWKGAMSDQFLIFAKDQVLKRQGKIIHVDITLVCEKPKIGPKRDLMVAKMAEILEISPTRVSIKATTSEKLGFTGREEGIAAQAVATIQIPAED